jgi:hypothetical protein
MARLGHQRGEIGDPNSNPWWVVEVEDRVKWMEREREREREREGGT